VVSVPAHSIFARYARIRYCVYQTEMQSLAVWVGNARQSLYSEDTATQAGSSLSEVGVYEARVNLTMNAVSAIQMPARDAGI